MTTYKPGDRVTVLPPYDLDPPQISVAPHVVVTRERRDTAGKPYYEVSNPMMLITGPSGAPAVDGEGCPRWQTFGPYPPERLEPGWSDRVGRLR